MRYFPHTIIPPLSLMVMMVLFSACGTFAATMQTKAVVRETPHMGEKEAVEGSAARKEKISVVSVSTEKVSCGKNTLNVRYHGDETWYNCSENGLITSNLSTIASEHIKCPKYSEERSIAYDGGSLVQRELSNSEQPGEDTIQPVNTVNTPQGDEVVIGVETKIIKPGENAGGNKDAALSVATRFTIAAVTATATALAVILL